MERPQSRTPVAECYQHSPSNHDVWQHDDGLSLVEGRLHKPPRAACVQRHEQVGRLEQAGVGYHHGPDPARPRRALGHRQRTLRSWCRRRPCGHPSRGMGARPSARRPARTRTTPGSGCRTRRRRRSRGGPGQRRVSAGTAGPPADATTRWPWAQSRG